MVPGALPAVGDRWGRRAAEATRARRVRRRACGVGDGQATVPDVRAAGPPATSVWLDLEKGAEHALNPGQKPPTATAGGGFLWVDVEVSTDAEQRELVRSGHLAEGVFEVDQPPGAVGWELAAERLELSFAGARFDSRSLILDRRHVSIGEGVVVSAHHGVPDHAERIRERYRGSFGSFAKSHGFLLFEICGAVVDDLHGALRALAERIDELGVATARGEAGGELGTDLLVAVLLLRQVLVRTRDVFMELASRRFTHVPETTQPYIRDLAGRLDGLVNDLAFSRDVLSEAMNAAPRPGVASRAELDAAPVRRAASERAPLRFVALGGFGVLRDGHEVPPSELGGEQVRQLLAALLCARRAVRSQELERWLWPDLDGGAARAAVDDAVSELRRALEPDADEGAPSIVVAPEPGAYAISLGDGDSWDVEEVRGAVGRASGREDPEERVELLDGALEMSSRALYPEWPYAEWTSQLRGELKKVSTEIRASLGESLRAAGRTADALVHFERLVDEQPERESWHRGVMRCHSARGDQALALRQYHTCRSILRQTRGVEPSPETNALYLEMLRSAPER